MKNKVKLIALLFIFSSSMVMGQTKSATEKTYNDIRKTLGSVPDFLKNYPPTAVQGAWEDMKAIELSTTTNLSGKQKELIGISVAAQIPCQYCIYFHTQAAKLNGATDKEISEALAMAGSVRRWSTIFHGNQISEKDFKSEVDQMVTMAQKKQSKQAMEEKQTETITQLKTPQDAYNDMKESIGFTPNFFKAYPESGIVAAWSEMKGLEMNPATALKAKDKELIGLSVAAQVPCPYCIYYHTEMAKLNGANNQEIQEAIAMAGLTRNWSTFINGQYTDSKKFESQTNDIMKFLKGRAAKEVTSVQ